MIRSQAFRGTAGSLFLLILVAADARFADFEDVAGPWKPASQSTARDGETKRYIIETTGVGAAILDFDGDGRNDLILPQAARLKDADSVDSPPPLLYRNLGGNRFEEVGADSGLTGGGWAQAVCAGDIDNDGDPDLFLTHFGQNRLYRNTGGRFEDITKGARLSGPPRWGAGCAFLDFDRDGRLDLFVSNYVDFDLATAPKPGSMPECFWRQMPVMCGPRGLPLAKNVLYRQRTDGTFEDVSAKAGILKPGGRYGLGVLVSDFDDDGWPDIYVACDQTPSLLYRNRRDGTFAERGVEAGVAYNFDGRLQAGMGIAAADFNGDGTIDIAKTNFSGDLPSLYLNEDGQFFRDVSREAGLTSHLLLGWGAVFLDIDEDGHKDLVLANGHVYPEVDRPGSGETYRQLTLVYRNLGNGKFADATSTAGPAFQVPRPARGLAAGDLDGDGRPELVIANLNEPPSVLRNRAPRGRWVRLELQGTRSNRSAIGARVLLTAAGRRQVDEVRSGGSYFSQSELTLHFGLGNAEQADVEVRWPSRLKEKWTGLAAGRAHRLIEGSAPAARPSTK